MSPPSSSVLAAPSSSSSGVGKDNDCCLLPSPNQTWVHAVDSTSILLDALVPGSGITAIETDIVMGTCITRTHSEPSTSTDDDGQRDGDSGSKNDDDDETKIVVKQPIMAHPPNTESDLSMTHFVKTVLSQHHRQSSCDVKIIKLDFKELETIDATLQTIADRLLLNNNDIDEGATADVLSNNNIPLTIFLNADILPGPGFRNSGDVSIPADAFMETCLPYIKQVNSGNLNNDKDDSKQKKKKLSSARFALSLGFKVACTEAIGYTAEDVQAMSDLIAKYQLLVRVVEDSKASQPSPGNNSIGGSHDNKQNDSNRVGVVMALNARLLHSSLDQFSSIMTRFPDLQILVWTGKGEPAITQTSVQTIASYFQELGMADRVGFDVQVAGSFLSGIVNDTLVAAYGYLTRTLKKIRPSL